MGEFEINAQNVTQIQEVTVKNKLMTGNLLLKKTFDGKTVAEAIENKLITADELSEVSFNVYRQTGTTPDIKNDELVTQEALQLRADGTLEYGPLTVGKYYVKEASAPAAYPVSDTLYPFEITAENYNSKYLMTVDNTKIVKSVEFTKVDASDGTGVSGARFTLYKKDVNGEYKPCLLYTSMENLIEIRITDAENPVTQLDGGNIITDKVFRAYRLGGKKATFLIKILFREHSTWQGTIYWREAGEKQSFRSFMEMIYLIASADGNADSKNEYEMCIRDRCLTDWNKSITK